MRKRTEKGFTLLELIVVVTIVGLLAGVAMVSVKNMQRKARENILKANLSNLRKGIDDFYADKQRYPSSIQELVDEGYMRQVPRDPITNEPDWEEIAEEPSEDGEELTGADGAPIAPGITDVKSKAVGSTLDGIPYNEL